MARDRFKEERDYEELITVNSEEDTNIRNPIINVIETKYKEHIENNKPKPNNRKKQKLND